MASWERIAVACAGLVAFGAGMGVAQPCSADDADRVLEVSVDLGVQDRGTTGIGEPLLDEGYDTAGGLLAGAGARMLFGIGGGEYFHHGVATRVSHDAGWGLGLSDRYGFAWSAADLAYAFRTNLPCMSTPERKLFLTGVLGVSGVVANAGTGLEKNPQTDRERRVASERLDHLALGPVLGVALDMHMGPVFLGLELYLRQAYALDDGPVSRSYVSSASMRVGFQLEP